MSAPPGWYDDPQLANTRRYWDGQQWTPHRQERIVSAPREDHSQRILLGYLFAALVPIIGFFIGVGLIGTETRAGWTVIALSIAIGTVYVIAFT